MVFKNFNEKFILRFEKGDNFSEELLKFCKDNQITLANFEGIGSFLSCELEFYHLDKKEYERKTFSETMEIVSLLGNISLVEEELFFHAHVTLSDSNFNAKGGHLFNATTGATLELVLEKMDGKVERKLSDDIGLKLLDLNN